MYQKGIHMKENVDYEKRELLIQAAKEEFMEKGYNKASLRNICSKAGMTTGALYFFFENKEDLYEEITGSAKNELKNLIIKHIAEDNEAMESITDINQMFEDHSSEADMFIECIYRNYDSFMLILSGSKEGEYEALIDELNLDKARCKLMAPTEKIRDEYLSSSVLVMSSRIEGFGMGLKGTEK